jgi:probable HAF family extracellular repeat protein
MGAKMLRRMFLTAGAGVMLAAMVAVVPASASAAPPGQRYTWTAIDVPGSAYTIPVTVNDLQAVVGLYADAKGPNQGFIEQGGRYTTVDYPQAVSTLAFGMTDLGEIVGEYSPSNGDDYGFIDWGGRFTTLQDPMADNVPSLGTTPQAVNNRGQIVGYYFDDTSTMHGFVYQNGQYRTLDCPGAGTGSDPSDWLTGYAGTYLGFVNDYGAIIGDCFEDSGSYYGFIYQDGSYNEIPNVPGASATYICWITDFGVTGGSYLSSDGSGVVGYVDHSGNYSTIEDPVGPYGIYVEGANNLGAMAGYYLDAKGKYNGFLMTQSH